MQTKEEGVRATNQDFIRYDQVEKQQNYHLAETAGDEQFDDDFEVRTVDVGRFLHGTADDKRAFATELGDALHDIGFAILEGHGVDPALYDEAGRRIEEIFSTLTLTRRCSFARAPAPSIRLRPDQETGDATIWWRCGVLPPAFEGHRLFWPVPGRRSCSAHVRVGADLPVMRAAHLPRRRISSMPGRPGEFRPASQLHPPVPAPMALPAHGPGRGTRSLHTSPPPRGRLQVLNRGT
jgi:hypothetical protein